ncbi:MAG: hypothetical protein ACQESC_00315 [Nanobdellota archaeon]
MIYKKHISMLLLLAVMVFLTACTTPIEDIKTEESVGETVTIKGTVQEGIELGSFSGYMLKGETDSIFVAQSEIPEKGSTTKVKGTIEQIPLIGTYYLETTSKNE